MKVSRANVLWDQVKFQFKDFTQASTTQRSIKVLFKGIWGTIELGVEWGQLKFQLDVELYM